MKKQLIAGLLIYIMAIGQAWPQAALLPNAKQTFLDNVGNPLSAGTVTFYVPNSTNKKTTWSVFDQTSNNTNPVILDSAGRAVIFGQGAYRQVLKDKNGVTIWDAYTNAYGSSAPSGATGTDTAPVGSVIPWASFVLPVNWQYAAGQTVSRVDFPDLLTALTIRNTSINCTASSTTLTGFADTSQIRVGAPIEATCFSTGITVASIVNATTITISSMASSTATVTATVFPWGNGDGTSTFTIPDTRGRVLAGPDALGGTAANRLQATTTISTTSGSPTASVTSATGLVVGMVITSANVPAGTTLNSWSGTTITMSGNASGSASGTAVVFATFQSDAQPAAFGGSSGHAQVTAELVNHNHTLTDPGHSHTLPSGSFVGTGTNSNHFSNTAVSADFAATASATTGITISPTGGGNASTIIQPTVTINYIIKVKANTTGAGGVVSWGGLTGDIATDATLQAYTIGTTNYAGIANAPTLTMLANISTSTAQPLPITNSQWLDATISASRGSLPYRGSSTWGTLALGANGTWLSSNGTDATWSALPIASSSQLGVVQGDGATLPISGPGVISCRTATNSLIGCSRPDGTTITAAGGVLTAVGAAATSIAVGVTTIASGTPGNLLTVGAGPILSQTTASGFLDNNFSTIQGSVLYRNASAWVTLPPGTNGQMLTSGGPAANISWTTGGGISSIVISATTGLTATGTCTVTSTGTCTLAADVATNANIWGAVTNKLLDAGNVFGSAGNQQTPSGCGTSSVTISLTAGIGFYCQLITATNFTLSNPTLTTAMGGRQGCIYFRQPASGTVVTITFDTLWVTDGGVSGKALTATLGATNRVCYNVITINGTQVLDFTLSGSLTH